MTYKTHMVIGWASMGVAIGCLLGIVGVVFAAMNTTSNEVLVILGSWAFGLWWTAVICGILASHFVPTRFERQRAVRGRHRLADAMKRLRHPRTPNHP
jgi:hypothetical protein